MTKVKNEKFQAKTGEISIRASEFFMLSKNIRPLPNLKEKDGIAFNSYEDKELRYRHRQLDLIANPNIIYTFRLRSKIISATRRFLDEDQDMDNLGFRCAMHRVGKPTTWE